MMLKFIGKILYPNQPDWQREKHMKTLIAAVVVGVIIACIVAVIILLKNSRI